MSTGPIEFLSDQPIHETPSTEFGGADGLIQPENAVLLKGDPEASGGHTLAADKRQALSDNHGVMARRAGVPLVGEEQTTGISRYGDTEVVDPVTGRVVDIERNIEGGQGRGELSDMKP